VLSLGGNPSGAVKDASIPQRQPSGADMEEAVPQGQDIFRVYVGLKLLIDPARIVQLYVPFGSIQSFPVKIVLENQGIPVIREIFAHDFISF